MASKERLRKAEQSYCELIVCCKRYTYSIVRSTTYHVVKCTFGITKAI